MNPVFCKQHSLLTDRAVTILMLLYHTFLYFITILGLTIPINARVYSSGLAMKELGTERSAAYFGIFMSKPIDSALKKRYPLVNIQKAIEHGHRNSGFSHSKW